MQEASQEQTRSYLTSLNQKVCSLGHYPSGIPRYTFSAVAYAHLDAFWDSIGYVGHTVRDQIMSRNVPEQSG